ALDAATAGDRAYNLAQEGRRSTARERSPSADRRADRAHREGLALLMSMPGRRIGVALAVWLVAAGAPAHADTERLAVVIGDNRGASDEQLLRYAESDAQRFADLLGDVGGVPSENQVVLRGKSADQVRRAVIATNERIRTTPHSAADAVLLVYYSGHGD